LQLQQADAPGVGIAVFLQTKQIAVGAISVGPPQDGLSALEDLIVDADADGGQVLLVVELSRLGDGLVDDGVDLPDGNRVVEEVPQELDDAAHGAVADQDQSEGQLLEPGLGDR